LLSIYARDPDARVLVLPSDHHFGDEAALARTLKRGFAGLEEGRPVLLVGMTPAGPETDYGWIVPAQGVQGLAAGVASFVEKPALERARSLFSEGALWNTFVFFARARGLVGLYARRAPYLLDAMRRALAAGADGVAELYERLDVSDFSRDLLQGAEQRLSVLAAPPCEWTDLGTPARVAACLRASEKDAVSRASTAQAFDLSRALQRTSADLALA
jgi:mannose-1-phosphate guanylyltransferase